MIDLLNLGYLGVFLFSFILNMLPFMSPSNLVLAGAVGVALPWMNPFAIGFLMALASSLAKMIHYYLTFFVGKALKISKKRLERYLKKGSKVGPVLIFLTAASPIPDEPVVIPLGIVKYSPIKFFVFFFSGKIIITTFGALAGSRISLSLENLIGNPILIVSSVILTVVTTYVLIKVDLVELFDRFIKRFG